MNLVTPNLCLGKAMRNEWLLFRFYVAHDIAEVLVPFFPSPQMKQIKKPVPYQQILRKFLCLHMEDHTAIEAFLVAFFYRASLIMSKEYNKYHRQ